MGVGRGNWDGWWSLTTVCAIVRFPAHDDQLAGDLDTDLVLNDDDDDDNEDNEDDDDVGNKGDKSQRRCAAIMIKMVTKMLTIVTLK